MNRFPPAASLLVLCIAAILLAGCLTPASPPSGSGGVAVQTSPASPSASLPTPVTGYTYSATPGPIQTVPDYEQISVTVDRNTITEDPTITTTFNGGLGLGMTVSMDVTIIRSDGVVETGHADYPVMGSSITRMGTTATDRVIVTVTMTSGDQYTIIDQYYPFPGSGNTG
jgi:hypothetical protein